MSAALTNPYVGPRPFSAAEAKRFFGREQETDQLLSLVLAERLILFYAQSGTGKSSPFQARLMPGLEQTGLIVLPIGRVSGDLPPGVSQVSNIFAFNLMLSLAQDQGDPNSFAGVSLSYFLARLTSDGLTFYYDSEAVPAAINLAEAATYVLLIDQFEEIITTHPEHWPERADFFRQLDQAMADDPLLRVVLTLREDFVAALDPYSVLLAGKLRARYYMQRMGQTAALAAIIKPAALGGRPFAPDVAESLVDNLRQVRSQTPLIPIADVGPVVRREDSSAPQPALSLANGSAGGGRMLGQFIEPVQLQIVCYQLWENLRDRPPGPITQENVETIGNVDKALADFYEQTLARTLAQLTSLSQLQLRTWFDRELVTEAGTRGTVYQGPKETAGLPNAAVKLLADQFLLRAEIRAGGTWYELVHDRFVEPILQPNRIWREQRLRQNPLIQAAYAWAEAGRPKEKLYRDEQLTGALATLDRHNQEPVVQEFLAASEEAQHERDFATERQRTERLRRALVINGAVLLLAVAAAMYALYQQTMANANARLAATREVEAVAAREQADANANLAATKAAEAGAAQATADAGRQVAVDAEATAQADRNAAVAAEVAAKSAQAEVEQLNKEIRSRQLAAESANQLRDNSYEVALPLAIEAGLATETFEANTALRQTLLHPGRTLTIFAGHAAEIKQARWNQDETKILTTSLDGTARIWDAATGKELATLTGHTDWIWQGSWNQDGTKILTASDDGTVRQYYARLADLLKLACQRAPRNLTQAEGAQFIKDEPYRATCVNLPIEE